MINRSIKRGDVQKVTAMVSMEVKEECWETGTSPKIKPSGRRRWLKPERRVVRPRAHGVGQPCKALTFRVVFPS